MAYFFLSCFPVLCVEHVLSRVTSAGQFVVQTGLNPVLAVSGVDGADEKWMWIRKVWF